MMQRIWKNPVQQPFDTADLLLPISRILARASRLIARLPIRDLAN